MSDPLVTAAVSGDEQAFEALLEKHYERIYCFAYRWCGNVADAQDVTQLACIKLARNIRQYRGEAAFSTWLFRVVVNCAKDWQKGQYRHQGDHLPLASLTTEPAHQAGIYLEEILSAIEAIGPGFRETTLLVLGEGFSHRQAADLLGVRESTVSWRLHRIRQHLQSLEKGCAGQAT